jgi:hypothetical protein
MTPAGEGAYAMKMGEAASFTPGRDAGQALSAGLPLWPSQPARRGTGVKNALAVRPSGTENHAIDRFQGRGRMADTTIKGPASYFPSIEKKYGRPISEWQELVRTHLPAKHMELVAMLKRDHGMGHGHANAVVAHVLASTEG